MPASRVCSRPGCANLITGRGSLCVEHERQAHRQREARRIRPQRSPYDDPRWRKFRKDYLKDYPFCVDCGRAASHVDHIIPIKDGGAFLDRNNVQSLCRSHHGKKTASRDGGFGNPKK